MLPKETKGFRSLHGSLKKVVGAVILKTVLFAS
jgi:hypothetical protein